ncbi:MAG TPA: hypothetical protein VF041_16070 [Gemmatimonadaceae bacterium]
MSPRRIAPDRRWLGRGAWSIADQGFFAAANLIASVLLARWLPPREYGTFAFSYSIFLLFGTVHTALLAEPMLIFGSGKYAGDVPDYVKRLLHGHWRITAGCSVPCAVAGVVLWLRHEPGLGEAFIGLAVAAPFILATWLLRRACYLEARPRWAATAGALYLLLMVSGTVFLGQRGALTIGAAFGVMAVASALAAAWLMVRLRALGRTSARAGGALTSVRGDHWAYGRWAAVTGMLSWVPLNLYYVALPAWGGFAAAGALKALLTLVMPLVQVQIALSNLLTPALVRARGRPVFARLLRTALVWVALASIGYWLVLGALHSVLVHALYGGRYDDASHLLWVVGLLPLATGTGEALIDALRALERPDLNCWAALASSLTTATVGLGAAAMAGLTGAAVGELLSLTVSAVMLWIFFARQREQAHRTSAGTGAGTTHPPAGPLVATAPDANDAEPLGGR